MKNRNTSAPESSDTDRRSKGLADRSREELIRIILRLEARLSRFESDGSNYSETQLLVTSEAYAPNLATLTFRSRLGTIDYRRLPVSHAHGDDNPESTRWRIVLISSDSRHQPLALEIYDDVVVGRGAGGAGADLDLTNCDGELLGVSRRHAMLRPTRRSLFLIDLGSTNGTFCNGVKLNAGQARRLTEREIISFGKLHFMLERVLPPPRT